MSDEQHARLFALEKRLGVLYNIVNSYEIAVRIYIEKDRVHKIVSAQKPEDI